MLTNVTPKISDNTAARAEHRQRLLAQLQAAAAPLLEALADTLVDAPDRELFRAVEIQARDLGQRLAAATQQAGLDDRKKGGM
jgi:hypothetical protein